MVSRLAEVEQRVNEVGERLARVVVLHDAPHWLYNDATVAEFRERLIAAVHGNPAVVRAYLRELGVTITVSLDGIQLTSALADGMKSEPTPVPASPARRAAS